MDLKYSPLAESWRIMYGRIRGSVPLLQNREMPPIMEIFSLFMQHFVFDYARVFGPKTRELELLFVPDTLEYLLYRGPIVSLQ